MLECVQRGTEEWTVLLRRRAERGASAVEFALVLPILLLLVTGIIQYGLYFWALQAGSDITRGAARLAAVGSAATCDAFEDDVTADVDDFGGANGVYSISRSYSAAEGNPDDGTVRVGDRVTVTVVMKTIDFDFPFLYLPRASETDPTVVVEQTAEARVERVDDPPEEC